MQAKSDMGPVTSNITKTIFNGGDYRQMVRSFQFVLDGKTMEPCFEVLCPLASDDGSSNALFCEKEHAGKDCPSLTADADNVFALAAAISDSDSDVDDDVITSSDPEADADLHSPSLITLPNSASITLSLPSQLHNTFRHMIPLLAQKYVEKCYIHQNKRERGKER